MINTESQWEQVTDLTLTILNPAVQSLRPSEKLISNHLDILNQSPQTDVQKRGIHKKKLVKALYVIYHEIIDKRLGSCPK